MTTTSEAIDALGEAMRIINQQQREIRTLQGLLDKSLDTTQAAAVQLIAAAKYIAELEVNKTTPQPSTAPGWMSPPNKKGDETC